MGWKFYGHAAVFGVPDRQSDVFAPSCFDDFLRDPSHLSIPLLNGHEPAQRIGRWVRMHQDGFGLFVIGELNDGLQALMPPFPGLSIKPVRAQGSSTNVWGGKLVRQTAIQEISIVTEPSNFAARIMGAW
jgi:uncharacterized protein